MTIWQMVRQCHASFHFMGSDEEDEFDRIVVEKVDRGCSATLSR